MKDRFPETLSLEIDRPLLRKYLRLKWFLAWQFGLVFFGGGVGFLVVVRDLERLEKGGAPIFEQIGVFSKGVALGLLVSVLIAALLYLILGHRQAANYADGLEVKVEGAFLRVCVPFSLAPHGSAHGYARSDRKLHFRSIIDYSIVEGPLMRRLGVMALLINTVGGGPGQNMILIPGIKNGLAARDMLAEIDCLRENGPS